MNPLTRVKVILLSVGFVFVQVIGILGVTQVAHAAPGNMQAPFDIGSSWTILQGYKSGPNNSHNGNSAFGLDLYIPGDVNASIGRTVRVPVGGTIYGYWAETGTLCINTGSRSYDLTHINRTIPDPGRSPSSPPTTVTAGQSVGTIAAAGLMGNNGTAHLHFQFWEGPNCYPQTTPVNPGIPFDSAHGLRMCGLPDLYDGGPVGTTGQGQWSGTPFTAQACGAPYPGVGNAVFKGVAQLTTGMRLNPNEYLTSLNGQSVLLMQADGNLVVHRGSSIAQWNSGTSNHPGAYLIVQGDGNVVVYAPNGQPLWWTGTNSVTRFTMQADGNLVGYDINSQWKWQSGTGGQQVWAYKGSDHLNQYQRLNPGEYLKSTDKRYFLLMQNDGNLVLYSPGYHVLWSSGTNGNAGAYLELQGDGNIVVYRADRWPLWFTGTNNAFDLFVQNDGNLVAYTLTDSWVWQSWTGGRI